MIEGSMDTRNPTTVVLEFIDKINGGDVSALCSLMTEDHVFVDGLGNRVQGREKLRAGWKGYLSLFPDDRISHESIFEDRDTVAVFGTASGTHAVNGKLLTENHWEIPAGWKAIVRNGLIAEWRVYCDNQPARKLLGERAP
jgi:ketosteroid isomerase-like protein